MSARNGRAFLFALTIFVLSAADDLYSVDKTGLVPSRDSIIGIVTQIQREDYEGDRPALRRLHDELTPIPEDNKLASRVLYWRGFALWRRAINGFNESPTPTDLEADLTQAVTDFKDAIARDPAFVEFKIGAGSSLGYLMYLHREDPTLMQEWANSDQAIKAGRLSAEVHGPWLIEPSAIHYPADPPGFEQYTVVLMKRGDHWNPNAPEFMDVMKQHHAFVKRMTDQGNMAIAGPFPFSDQGELRGVAIFRVGAEQTAKLTQDDPIVKAGLLKAEIHPWGTGKGVLASGQPMQ